jgi:hypothetical protein
LFTYVVWNLKRFPQSQVYQGEDAESLRFEFVFGRREKKR